MDERARCGCFFEAVERRLEEVSGSLSDAPALLRRAVKYALFPGGKRIRPLLLLAAADAVGAPEEKALACAAGIEMIHTFSLIHDDLPCMDNDDLRRGKPTVHKKFGEAVALLAGDALLAMGFEEAAHCGNAEAVRLIGRALGAVGMAGGQAADIAWQGRVPPARMKRWIDRKKTGELFSLCFEIPPMLVRAPEVVARSLAGAGRSFGLAFQALDDIDDGEQQARARKTLSSSLCALDRDLSDIPGSGLLRFLVERVFGRT